MLRARVAARPRARRCAAPPGRSGSARRRSSLYVRAQPPVWQRSAIPGGVGSVPAAAGATRRSTSAKSSATSGSCSCRAVWMRHQFAYLPLWKTWFKGLVGRFGWLDYEFPEWVYQVALRLAALVIALAVGELVRRRGALRAAPVGEFAVYVLAVVGAVRGDRRSVLPRDDPPNGGGRSSRPATCCRCSACTRALVALAVRFGGRRWGPRSAVGSSCSRSATTSTRRRSRSRATTHERGHGRDPRARRRRAARARRSRRSRAQTVEHELLVCDSGSSDGSRRAAARAHGARVIEIAAGELQPRRHAQPADERGRAASTWRC